VVIRVGKERQFWVVISVVKKRQFSVVIRVVTKEQLWWLLVWLKKAALGGSKCV